MGNCLAKPPKHERINEFNHLLSDSVHVYNGKKINHMTSSSDLCWKEEETPRFQFSDFLGDKLLSESPHSLATTVQSSNASSSPQNQDEKRNDIDNQWPDPSGSPEHNAWDTARSYIKGESALELRLAKNQLLSPLSMGDDFRTLSDFPNLKEDLNRAFESSFSDGVVWAEIDRPKKVTAIAMSRNENWQDPTNNISGSPLLFAIATDDGTIALMEVLDEKQIPWSGMKCTGNNSFELSSDDDDGDDYLSCRKFGAQVELPLVGRIRSLDFSPDGKYLAVGGDSCVAYLVAIVFSSRNRLADLKIVQKLERVDRVYAVRFSLDSKYLAIGGFDSAVTVATVNTSLVINQSPTLNEVNMPGLVFCLDWGESHLAVGVSNGFTIFDRNNEMVKHFHRPSSVETIKWSPCGAFLAVGDIEVIIYENKTFESRCVIDSISRDSKHFKYRITSLCWSPCATFLAIGETDGTCLVVETKSFALVHKVCRPYLIVGLAWGQQRKPNGEFRRYLGVGDDSCQVVLIKAGEETNGSLMLSMEVSSEASTIFSKASDWVLRDGVFRDVEDVLEPPRRSQPDGAVIAVAFSRCRKRKFSSYMAYVAEDCSLTIASTRDWNPILEMEFSEPIRSLSFSHSDNYLALGGDDGILYILSVPSRSMILNQIYSSSIQSIAFSKYDERLAVGLADGIVCFLSPDEEWEKVGEIDYNDSPILCQTWSSNNFAIGREDGSVSIFDKQKALLNFFVPVAEFFTSSFPVRSIAFGPGGKYLVFGGDDDFASIVNYKDGWFLSNQVELNCKSVLTTKWSPGGRYLMLAGSDQTFRVINTLTGNDDYEIHKAISKVFKTDSKSNITCVDFSIDGRFIALGNSRVGVKVLGTADWQAVGPSSG